MSSMFKKKGGPAFKPKIPSARPRPTRAAASQPPKTVEPVEQALSAPPEAPKPQAASDKESESIPTDSTPAATEKPTSASRRQAGKDPEPDTARELREEPPPEATTYADHSDGAGEPASVEPAAPEPDSEPQARPSLRSRRKPEETSTHEQTPAGKDAPPEVSEETPAPGPGSTVRKTRSKRQATAKPNTRAEDSDTTSAPRRAKRKRQTSPSRDDDDNNEEGAQPATRGRKRGSRISEPRRRQPRSVTPEDAEEQVVDLQKLKMSDLTKDLHIGKKFSRHDELRERERQAKLKARMQKDGEPVDDEIDKQSTPGPTGGTPTRGQDAGTPNATSTAGPQFRIVDGQIVVDQSSLVMDRHARAAATQQDMETIEENDFTRLITSNSFMNTSKLKGPNIWTAQETELFYKGLRMFGTDFEMISQMFPGKQRRHVKLKFNREERHNPRLIDATLIGEKTTKLNIEEYKTFTGGEFESVESIEADQRRIQEEFEAEQKRRADEQAEAMRRKREELFADDDADDASKKKGKKGKKKGKGTVEYGLNGEPINVVEA